jgi:Zn-dependent peptidase ImmA (M78 family)
MTPNLKAALSEAAKVRRELNINSFEPVNIFDVCRRLEVQVRFDEVNMEGVYVMKGGRPFIILSNLRPMSRRVFTCAHELGHHRFGHGDRVDGFTEDNRTSDEEEEKLVDMFAGSLLMPSEAIRSQFVKRKWLIGEGGPVEFQTVASAFGVGYETLITHCSVSRLIDPSHKAQLLKTKLHQILNSLVPSSATKTFFKIIDKDSRVTSTDMEVTSNIILPGDCIIEGNHLEVIKQTSVGMAYKAVRPGIVRVVFNNGGQSIFIRVQRLGYQGWADYRHLEN